MNHPDVRRRTLLTGLGLGGLGLTGVAGLAGAGSALAATAARYPVARTDRTFPAGDGVRLTGSMSVPDAPGRWPLVVLPGTFAGTSVRLDDVGEALAARGYATLTYIERGFGPSEGLVDGAGPRDVRDVSDMIDWALANLPCDPARIGLGGLSYGAGIALIAASLDSRVKAVAALSGWADMGAAFYPNRTRAQLTLEALVGVLYVTGQGRPTPQTRTAFDDAISGRDISGTLAFARTRSATTYAASMAAHAPALFVAEPMNETVFPVDQSVAFWEAYTAGPKHLDLRAGDHGNQETLVVTGQVPDTWLEAFSFFDAYLARTDRTFASRPPVRVVPRSPSGPRPVERTATTVPPRRTRLHLATTREILSTTHTLRPAAGTGRQRLRRGENWLIRPAVPMWTFLTEVLTGTPPSVSMLLVDPTTTGVWRTPALKAPLHYRGELTAHLTLTPSAAKGTVVVQVLDVDALGLSGGLVARQPWSWAGATPGRSVVADLRLPYNAYDVPAGHRLAVVVSTSDVSFANENPHGASVVVEPQSWVDVPLRA